MLDNVIDVSEFSVEKVARTFRDNRCGPAALPIAQLTCRVCLPVCLSVWRDYRRIGLGIMGFADMLYQLGVAITRRRPAARRVMRCIRARRTK